MSSSFKFGSPASLEKCDFVTTFGAIYEHSPWIAEQAFDRGITAKHDQIEALHGLFCDVFLSADKEAQLGVIIAHPDLAGRAARAGELTKESTNEQASAGIDTLTEEEFNRFTELNDAYKAKFGFPFIMAVKGSNGGAAFLKKLDGLLGFRLQSVESFNFSCDVFADVLLFLNRR